MPGRTTAAPPAAAHKAARTAAGGKATPSTTADQADDDGSLVALHRVRFVAWSPSPVVAVAARPDGAVLAAAREDGEIEAWDAVAWARLVRIPGRDGAALTSLAWAADADEAARPGATSAGTARLFSGGLDGRVMEWCAATRGPASPPADIGGGAVWALVADPAGTRLAAACDDGGVRVLAPGPAGGGGGPDLVRALPRTPGRALCVAWHPSGRALAAGSSEGGLHVWDTTTGVELLRLDAGGSASSAGPVPVWSVAILADGTLATGDGAGAVRLWDGRTGAQVGAFPAAHAADVLALVSVPASGGGAGLELFSAGADGGVACFRSVPHKGGGGAATAAAAAAPAPPAWVAGPAKRPHTHDVRCLALIPGRRGGAGAAAAAASAAAPPLLASGGNDAHVLVHAGTGAGFGSAHPARVSRAPQPPLTALVPAREGGGRSTPSLPPLILAVAGRTADVWALGSAAGRAAHEGGASGGGAGVWAWREGAPVDVTARPARLARVTLAGADHVVCAALARAAGGGGQAVWLAAGTRARGALFSITPPAAEAGPPAVRRLAWPDGVPPPVALAFSAGLDGREEPTLVAASPDGGVSLIRLSPPPPPTAGPPAGGGGGGRQEGSAGAAAAAAAAAAAPTLLATLRPPHPATPSARAAALSSADPAVPAVTALATSACGRWAAAVGPAGVDVYSLGGPPPPPPQAPAGRGGRGGRPAATPAAASPPAHHWRVPPPPDGAAPAAAAFAPTGGSELVVASAACGLAAYDVAGRAPLPWPPGGQAGSAGGGGGVPPLGLPGGAPCALSLRPCGGGGGSTAAAAARRRHLLALLATPAALCAVDLAGPPVPGRGGGAGGGAGAGKRGRAGRPARGPARPPPDGAPAPAGHNPRPLPLEHPCLAAGYVGPGAAVLVERRWADVAAGLPAPLHRHRYGT